MTPRVFVSATAAVACILACGYATAADKPTEELARAHAVVDQADKTDAQRFAAADLQKAHDELTMADQMVSMKKYVEAKRYAENAAADADVAEARAGAAQAQHAADEVHQSINTLKQEANRQSNNAAVGPPGVGLSASGAGAPVAPAPPPPAPAVTPGSDQ